MAELSCIPLFSRKSRRDGLLSFLTFFVFPQIAVFLWRGFRVYDATTPLCHLRSFLPSLDTQAHNPTEITRTVVRAQLKFLPENASKEATSGIERLLSHLDSRSNPSRKTIDDCCQSARDALRLDLRNHEKADLHMAQIKASINAGVAVKRFIELLRAPDNTSDGSSYLAAVSHYYDNLTANHETAQSRPFYQPQLDLFNALMERYPLNPGGVPEFQQNFIRLVDLFMKNHGCQRTSQCEPLVKLQKLLKRPTLHRGEHARVMKSLIEHEQFSLFRPIHLYYSAFLPLAEGNLPGALELFRQFLHEGKNQQLGLYTAKAASFAIALEVMTRPYVLPGGLEALVLQRNNSVPQSVELKMGIPTVFGDFCKLPELSISAQFTLDSIAEFNAAHYPLCKGGNRVYCNPLQRLDALMEKPMAWISKNLPQAYKKTVSLEEIMENLDAKNYDSLVLTIEDRESIHQAIVETDKVQPVLSFCKLRPYEALRDISHYLDRMSPESNKSLGFDLNKHLTRFVELPKSYQKAILKAFDLEAFQKDEANPPLFGHG